MIDNNYIQQLKADLGQEGFTEIASIFFSEVEEVLDRIRKERPSATDMHFLKGSAANIGFVSFSKACQIAQHALLEEQEFDVEKVFESYAASKLEFSSAFLKAQHKPVQIKN